MEGHGKNLNRQSKEPGRWLEIKQVAAEYPWSRRVIYDGLENGTFPVPAKRVGRKWIFDRQKIEAFWEGQPNVHEPGGGGGR